MKGFEYYAFISYKREDEKWAKWLQHKLEYYRLPASARHEDPSLPEKLRPIFKDTTDLEPGVLAQQIQQALASSKYLIVICSPRSANSAWVSKEVQTFIDQGRTDYIIPFIIGGTPNAADERDECFPEGLRKLAGEQEILGANINEMGRDAAAIKIVARITGLRFDTLWQRWEKAKRNRRILIGVLSAAMILVSWAVLAYIANQNHRLEEANRRIITERDRAESERSRAENEKNRAEKERNRAEIANIQLSAANDSILKKSRQLEILYDSISGQNKLITQINTDLTIQKDNLQRANREISENYLAQMELNIEELIGKNQYKAASQLLLQADEFSKQSNLPTPNLDRLAVELYLHFNGSKPWSGKINPLNMERAEFEYPTISWDNDNNRLILLRDYEISSFDLESQNFSKGSRMQENQIILNYDNLGRLPIILNTSDYLLYKGDRVMEPRFPQWVEQFGSRYENITPGEELLVFPSGDIVVIAENEDSTELHLYKASDILVEPEIRRYEGEYYDIHVETDGSKILVVTSRDAEVLRIGNGWETESRIEFEEPIEIYRAKFEASNPYITLSLLQLSENGLEGQDIVILDTNKETYRRIPTKTPPRDWAISRDGLFLYLHDGQEAGIYIVHPNEDKIVNLYTLAVPTSSYSFSSFGPENIFCIIPNDYSYRLSSIYTYSPFKLGDRIPADGWISSDNSWILTFDKNEGINKIKKYSDGSILNFPADQDFRILAANKDNDKLLTLITEKTDSTDSFSFNIINLETGSYRTLPEGVFEATKYGTWRELPFDLAADGDSYAFIKRRKALYGDNETIELHTGNMRTGHHLHSELEEGIVPYTIKFNSDGTKLMMIHSDGFRVYNISDGKQQISREMPNNDHLSLIWADKTNPGMAYGYKLSNGLYRINLNTGQGEKIMDAETIPPTHNFLGNFDMSNDGSRYAILLKGKEFNDAKILRIYDLPSNSLILEIPADMYNMQFFKDNNHIISNSGTMKSPYHTILTIPSPEESIEYLKKKF